MADKTINELTAATTMGNDDLLVLQQGGTAKKLSGKQLGDYVYNAAAEKVAEVNKAVDDARSSINDIVESVQSMTELGTDTTLTTTGMAADAKAAGDKIKAVETAAMADLSQGTASGSIVTITDGADNIPVKKLTINIRPVQEGSGDPSPENVRPITGWTGAKVMRTGVNVLDLADAGIGTGSLYNKNSGKISIGGSGATISGTNPITITNTTNWCGAAFFTKPLKADSYRFRYRIKGEVNANVKSSFYEVDSDNNIVAKLYIDASVSQDENYVYHPAFTIANDGDRIAFCVESNTAQTITIYDLSANYPDTDMDYHAYTGTTIPIIFPSEAGTVYGGKLEINEDGSGVLTVDKAMTTVGALSWSIYSGTCYATIPDMLAINGYRISDVISDTYGTDYSQPGMGSASSWNDLSIRQNSAGGKIVYVKDARYTSASAFKTTQADTQILYVLETPITYSLTIDQIKSLLGTNNIWADTGDITGFIYRKAPVDLSYVDAKIDEIEPIIAGRETAMTATKNYSSGGLVIVNHTLYKLDANVASGETLTPNTNCHMTTVEAEIAECVPYYRSINGTPLSSDVTLTAEDIPYDDALAEHTSGSVGEVVSDLKESISANLVYIEDATNGINYDYASYYKQDGQPSASDSTRLGITQINNRIILDGDISNMSEIMVRLNSGVTTTVAGSIVRGWDTGIALEAGHTYRATVKYLGEHTLPNVVSASVYRKGQSSTVGTLTIKWPITSREFTAEENTVYNICLYLQAKTYVFDNDEFLITITDITNELKKEDLLVASDYLDGKINLEHNLIDYGYYNEPVILAVNPDAANNSSTRIGVEAYRTRYKLNYAGGLTGPCRIKISNGLTRAYGGAYYSFPRLLQLQSGHTYDFEVRRISGSCELDGAQFVPQLTVYDENSNNTILTLIETTDEKRTYQFTATDSKVLLCIYVNNESTITDYVCDISLRDITTEISGAESYYASEIADTVAKVQNETTEPSLVFLWSTDNHRMSNNAAGVQNFSHMIQNMRAVAREINIDFNLCTGDLTDGDTAKDTTLSRAYECMTDFQSVNVPFVWAMGNHDTNPYISSGALILNLAESYKAYFAHTKGMIYNQSENGTDYYIDFDNLDTRLICLNANNSADGSYYTYGASTASWLTTALDTNKNVIVALHQSPIASQVYDNRTTTRASGITAALNTFVNNGGNLIMLSGHSHLDIAFITPFLCIMQDCQRFSDIAEDITDENHGITGFIDVVKKNARIENTMKDDCWSVGIFKPGSNDLSMIRFGAGCDRYFHITPVAPATLIPKLSGVLTWSSSNDAVAEVADGVVTGVASGRCAILAKDTFDNYECWIVEVT